MSPELAEPAIFSPDRAYRYTLYRDLDPMGLSAGLAVWCALNPSTADEERNDPTITREMDFTRRWGYRHLLKINAFAYRSTDPRAMMACTDPVGPDNDHWIRSACAAADIIILAWGVHGAHRGRDADVLQLMQPWAEKIHHLGVNRDGSPKHPLYLKGSTQPVPCRDLVMATRRKNEAGSVPVAA